MEDGNIRVSDGSPNTEGLHATRWLFILVKIQINNIEPIQILSSPLACFRLKDRLLPILLCWGSRWMTSIEFNVLYQNRQKLSTNKSIQNNSVTSNSEGGLAVCVTAGIFLRYTADIRLDSVQWPWHFSLLDNSHPTCYDLNISLIYRGHPVKLQRSDSVRWLRRFALSDNLHPTWLSVPMFSLFIMFQLSFFQI